MGESLYILHVTAVIWCLRVAEGTEFVMSPLSVNATLNSTVIFTCQATGLTGFVWRINNTLTPSSFSIGDMAQLEVFCSEDRDMSVVECGGRSGGQFIFGDSALLQVQGLLTKVTNLSVLSTTTSITLTWIPPSSLDITDVEPDFTHTVEIYNITSGVRQELGVYENIVTSSFTFTLTMNEDGGAIGDNSNSFVNPDLSDAFQFIITAVNAVGRGAPCEINTSFLQADKESLNYTPTSETTTKSKTSIVSVRYDETSSPMPTVAITTHTIKVTKSSSPPAGSDFITPGSTIFISLATLILGVILGVVITLLIIIVGLRVRQYCNAVQETINPVSADSIEMKSCDAYDVARKRKQVKNKPPVYEEVV